LVLVTHTASEHDFGVSSRARALTTAALIALMFGAIGGFAFALSSEVGQRNIARFYGTHLVSRGQSCPTKWGPMFWFDCEAAARGD
jgi:hypothetical protein